ncbi:MAG: Rne/Rng family ribonuclease [Acidobacteria bacterium]|nr:MAG: Rne/Rng family ribonuclease [Acidobacteriota bacterium]
MSKIMLVNVTHVEETRVAVVENGVLAAYEIETLNRTSLKGNIYNAVVDSVHASLEAAFVRIGPDMNGFLPLDQINFRLLPKQVDGRKFGKVGQHLKTGQKLLVQAVREPFHGKPPTVSTYFSLPGRFLVLMPGVESSGVSRKIEDGKQRDRLRKIIDELKVPDGFGVIVRTAGIGQTKTELQRDLRYLLRLWESIQRASQTHEFPSRVYQEADLVIRTIRDHLTPDIMEVLVDSKETFDNAQAFARDVMPKRAKTLKLYTGDRPLFNKFNLEEQIERIYKRRVPLPSGGEIVIDGTEALTAIDVNSARSKRQGDAEETVTVTNVEAAEEIARQLRLRDLGGLIVVDFIDMALPRNKKRVEKAIRDAMKGDRARHDITTISKLGLMEIARQRIKGSKMAASYNTCPACDGHGLIKNVEAAALSALRRLQTRGTRSDIGRIRLTLAPDVANWLLNHKREDILSLERQRGVHVEIASKESLLRHESQYEAFVSEEPAVSPVPEPPASATPVAGETAKSETPAGRQRAPAETEEPKRDDKPAEDKRDETSTASAAGESESRETRRRRRRRRRRRPSDDESSAAGDGAKPPAESVPAVAVPTNLRADELMPAATGAAQRAEQRSSRHRGDRSRK